MSRTAQVMRPHFLFLFIAAQRWQGKRRKEKRTSNDRERKRNRRSVVTCRLSFFHFLSSWLARYKYFLSRAFNRQAVIIKKEKERSTCLTDSARIRKIFVLARLKWYSLLAAQSSLFLVFLWPPETAVPLLSLPVVYFYRQRLLAVAIYNV